MAVALLASAVWAGSAAAQQAPARDSVAAWLARGDSAWAREDHPAAFAAYDAVVRADSTQSTRALFRVGLLHAWRNRLGAALSALRAYVRAEPADLEGRVVLARTYAWANRTSESLAHYDTVLAREPRYRDAVVGRATALAWADRIPEAERALERWLEQTSDDAEAWVSLGTFRRWRGDPRAAAQALERAVALAPNNSDARLQLQWAEADYRPTAAATLIWTRDSERNVLLHQEVRGGALTTPHLRLGFGGRVRTPSVGAEPRTQVPMGFVEAQWQPGGGAWVYRADAGAVSYPLGFGLATQEWIAGIRAAGRVGSRWRLGVGARREPFDEVWSMADRAMTFSVGEVDASVALSSRLSLSVAASRGTAEGYGITDSRSTGLAALRWTPRRGMSFGLSHREIAWDEPAYGIFFAPQRWSVTEVSAGWAREEDLGLVLAGDLALGLQGVGFEDGPVDRSVTPRASLRTGWRFRPGREVVGTLLYANVAGAGAITASDYRYGAMTLGVRWTF